MLSTDDDATCWELHDSPHGLKTKARPGHDSLATH